MAELIPIRIVSKTLSSSITTPRFQTRLLSVQSPVRSRLTPSSMSLAARRIPAFPARTLFLPSQSLQRPAAPQTQSRSLNASSGIPSAARQTSTTTTSSPTAASTTASVSPPSPPLTWNQFFSLRLLRRRVTLASSILSSLGTIAFLTPLMAAQELEVTIAELTGMNPMMGIGIAVCGIGAVGFFTLGPLMGSLVFRTLKGQYLPTMRSMEDVFLKHVRRNRADPASSSLSSPIVDYYGEKVGSVQGYRRWLRDQRAFARKTKKGLL